MPGAALVAALTTVHVGQSAVLLRTTTGDLLPVTSSAHGLVPGGWCLPDDREFAALATAARQRAVLDLRSWQGVLAATAATDLSVRPGAVDVVAARALADAALSRTVGDGASARPARPDHGPMDPFPLRRCARALVRAAAAGDGAAVHDLLERLVGVGPGSTPSGDDVVVGVLAGLDRRADGAARSAAAPVRQALPHLLDRTTSVSRHDLVAALRGEVAERVHHLLAAVGDRSLVPTAVDAARTWGATSGLDLAAGVAAGSLAPAHSALRPRAATPSPFVPLRRSA